MRPGIPSGSAFPTIALLGFVTLLGTLIAARAETSCTILADASTGAVVYSEGECDTRVPPASTFKIPISLMGFDSGVLTDAVTPVLAFKPGYPDWIEAWRRDTDPSSWMRNSVVWYSQRVTEALGKEKFAGYVRAFAYGNADVTGDPGKDNGLTRSWLSSSLRISASEQVAFLVRLVNRTLPVSARALDMTEMILEKHDLADGWTVHGKTGTGFAVNADGAANRNRPFGWYVGWAVMGDRTIAFARLRQFDEPRKMTPGLGARDEMLERLPALLEAI
ncbi:MAG: class D beta-lactamase [Rhizobiaceae bacterium]